MKKSIVVLLAVFTVFAASCSDMNENYNPVSPGTQLQKSVDPGPAVGAYQYLQEFSVYRVENWEVNETSVTVWANPLPENALDAFVEIIYQDSKELYYVEKPNFSTEVVLDINLEEKIVDVIVYVNYRKVEGNFGSYEFPYSFMNRLSSLPVDRWKYDGELKVIASGWTDALNDVFMELSYGDEGSVLVYIQKPESGQFSVSGLSGRNLESVYLFGNEQLTLESFVING